MASENALMHFKVTVLPAVLLTLLAYPVLSRAHVYKTALVVTAASLAAIPWFMHLIQSGLWEYPEPILGWTLLGIPVEVLFFFAIQTYVTSLVYILCNVPVLTAKYLEAQCKPNPWFSWASHLGQTLLLNLALLGLFLIQYSDEATYLGVILVWAAPIALFNWSLAGKFILSLPRSSTLYPVLLSVVYFWLVNGLVLGRGTWAVDDDAKLGIRILGSLALEDALFVLAVNVLVVSGLVVADQALAIIDASPDIFPVVPRWPSLCMMVDACSTRAWDLDLERIVALREADDRLADKSKSFHFASFSFSGRFRIDLVFLYSFCRVADDLIDEAETEEEIRSWTAKLVLFLDCFYVDNGAGVYVHRKQVKTAKLNDLIETQFAAADRSALRFLPTAILPGTAFYGLVKGFKMDAQFKLAQDAGLKFPISDEGALRVYAYCVAGTIGELCLALVNHHCQLDRRDRQLAARLGKAAESMGIALQLINIARDVATDAAIGRVYLPTAWLEEKGLTPETVVDRPGLEAVYALRMRLLDTAIHLCHATRPAMNELPREVRSPMILVAERYMEIGRILREMDAPTLAAHPRVPVPAGRLLMVVVKAFGG